MSGPAHAEIVRLLAGAATVDDASHDLLEAVATRLGWDVALLWLPTADGALLRRGTSWSRADAGLDDFLRVCDRLAFAPGVGLPGRVWSRGRAEWLEDLDVPGFPRSRRAASAGLRSAVALPVTAGASVVGVIELLATSLRVRDPEQLDVLATVAGQLGHFVARVRAEERLRENEERTAAIVEAALDCVITLDHHGDVVDFNPAAEATFGYTREQAIGQSLAELIVPEHLRAAHRAGLARYLATGEPRILNRRLELEALSADGRVFPVELTVTRLGRREPPVFAGFVRDISGADTDRRRMTFLANAGLRMAAALDSEAALEEVARAAVPDLADLCVVAILEPAAGWRSIAIAHVDPESERVARELAERYPDASTDALNAVARTGEPRLFPEYGEEQLAASAVDDEHLRLLRALGNRSALSVPIRASGRTLGVIALSMGPSGRTLGEDDLVVATALAARAGLHIENARLYNERSAIADTLQRSLLPEALPDIPGIDVAARFRPAGDRALVGGDFYDVFPSGDGVWTAVIGDVAGKGTEAAALTALARHTLYATALREPSPASNLVLLNEAMLHRTRGPGAFCTVICARLRPRDGAIAVTLASGGHPPPLILRADGTVERVELPGTLVGALAEADFEDRELTLARGELLLLYTDGAVELRRSDLGFGEDQLVAVLRETAGQPAEAVVDALDRRVRELQGDAARDDVALLVAAARM
jgi:PAS domain S-box-containing protein